MSEEVVDFEEETMQAVKNDTTREPDSRKNNNYSKSEGGSSYNKRRGRGHDKKYDDSDGRYHGRGGVFERLENHARSGPVQSIEGWIIIVTNVHQEAQEEDIVDKFSEFGTVKNIHVNLDRRTGFAKGYVLIEYETKEEGLEAIRQMNGKKMFDQIVNVDWAFVKK